MRRFLLLLVFVPVMVIGMAISFRPSLAADTAALAAPATPFPQVLQTVTLAADADLRDFRFDARAQRLYVTDSGGTLTVLDSDTYAVLATLPIGGDLLLDERSGRLYVYPGLYGLQDDGEKVVTVVDTRALTITGTLPDASFVAIDPVYGRVFTGARYTSYVPENTTPIRVYDATTLQETGVISMTGIPVYNPMRRELIVLAYRTFTVDLTTGEEVADLLPEQTSHPFEFCNGCDYPVAADVFPGRNLIVVRMQRMSTGGGGGIPPAPRYFDATTLAPIAAADVDLMLQPTCSTQPVLTPAVDGRLYENQLYARYIVVRNWAVDNTAGNRVAVRDGVYADFVNPATRQAIVDQGYVVDLATLLPIGRFPAFCWFAYDAVSGRIFGRNGGDLLVMAETGGTPVLPQPSAAAELSGAAIAQIVLSPNLATDGTVFLATYHSEVYRSGDGGDTWVQLHGGLPHADDLILTLAVSPDFAADRTLFVGGDVPMVRGEGVLKSTDAGETWTPYWQGMDHLRVKEVVVSPTYGEDQGVFAQAEYYQIEPWQSGRAIYASADGGLSWRLALTSTGTLTDDPFAATWNELTAAPTLPVRFTPYADALEVRQDGAWRSVDLGLAEGDYLYDVVAAPNYPVDPAIYVRTRLTIYRTDDDGQSWRRWDDARLAGRDYTNDLSALAVGRGAAGHVVFVGTTNGELWRIAGEDLTLTPVDVTVLPEPTSVPTPTATPIPTPSPIPATPQPLTGEPPAGFFRPEGPLGDWWAADADLQARLGWALSKTSEPVSMAQQAFTTGVMIWRSDTQTIYGLADDGGWSAYPDTFVEGEPEQDPSLTPPPGFEQPIRGFGKVWREHPDLAERLGWAMTPEGAVYGMIHRFEHGLIIGTGVRTYALIEETPTSGMWK